MTDSTYQPGPTPTLAAQLPGPPAAAVTVAAPARPAGGLPVTGVDVVVLAVAGVGCVLAGTAARLFARGRRG